MNYVLEDIFMACMLDFIRSCEDYIPLKEFAYSNNFQSVNSMAPYDAFYGNHYVGHT